MKQYDLVIFIANLLSLVGLFEISVASLGCVNRTILFKMLFLAKKGAVLVLKIASNMQSVLCLHQTVRPLPPRANFQIVVLV